MRKNKLKIITKLPKISARTRRRIAVRKRVRKIAKGVIHVQASFRNTIISVTDPRGRVIFSSCAGICGFKGPRRRTPFAAKTAAEDAVQTVMAQGMRRAQVMVKGAGRGRNAALKAIARSGLRIRFFRDVTPLPHNGCRPPKRRRL